MWTTANEKNMYMQTRVDHNLYTSTPTRTRVNVNAALGPIHAFLIYKGKGPEATNMPYSTYRHYITLHNS